MCLREKKIFQQQRFKFLSHQISVTVPFISLLFPLTYCFIFKFWISTYSGTADKRISNCVSNCVHQYKALPMHKNKHSSFPVHVSLLCFFFLIRWAGLRLSVTKCFQKLYSSSKYPTAVKRSEKYTIFYRNCVFWLGGSGRGICCKTLKVGRHLFPTQLFILIWAICTLDFFNIIIVFFQRQTIESRATVISCPV